MLTKTRYSRTAPNGDQSIIIIKTDEEVAYHSDLAGKGFEYKEIKVAAPVDSVCVSCEG